MISRIALLITFLARVTANSAQIETMELQKSNRNTIQKAICSPTTIEYLDQVPVKIS